MIKKIIIQGFGNVGSIILLNHYSQLVPRSSVLLKKNGAIFNKEGINIIELEKYKQDKNTILGFPNTETIDIFKRSTDL